MSAKNKLFCVAGTLGIIVLAGLLMFSACDNRKAINPAVDVEYKIIIDITPDELVVYSQGKPDTIIIDIWVTNDRGQGIDSAYVTVSRSPETGTLVPPGLTEEGHTQALFITGTGLDDVTSVIFTAQSDSFNYSDTLNSAILSITYPEQTMFMSFNPPELVIYSSENVDTVTLDIWVRDRYGSGISGVDVLVSREPEIGTLIQPGPTENGYTQCIFVVDPGIEYDTTIIFTAQSPKASYVDTLSILYSSHMVSMSFNPPHLIIYSPNKPDTVEINIWVRNEDGSGVDSVEVFVSRSPEVGSIVPPPLTTNGYTQALYITDPGNYGDTLIEFTARTGSATDVDTLGVTPRLEGEIAAITISLQKTRLIADGVDETKIYVFVTDTTGSPIGDHTPICMLNYGASSPGYLNPPCTTTVNGTATFVLLAPNILDTLLITEVDSLITWGVSVSGDTSFAYATVIYEPGEPADLNIITIPPTMVAGSGESIEIWCRVTDAQGSYVIDGTMVKFKNELLSSDITSLTTTENGYAVAVYTVGTEAGIDFIWAFIAETSSPDTLWSNSVSLVVRSSEPTNVALTTSDPNIEVGGIATMIYATLQDENENPLSDGFGVLFEITAAPAIDTSGPSFEHVPFDSVTHEVEAVTDVNGRAAVTLFSGTRAGTVRIKATSVDNPNIFKEKPLVTIQSGPPANIEIASSNIPTPEGEALITGITALVWDQYTNPVEPLTAVYFGVIPDTVADIEGFAVTGGWVNEDGDTVGVKGLAHTWMAYPCSHTFDTVRVVASSGDMADTSGPIVLALYEGEIDMWANPGVCYCQTLTDTVYADVTAQLLDGLGCTIHNGIIIFTASVCGNLEGQTLDTTDIDGNATSLFRIIGNQIPNQPPPLPPACTAKVTGKLLGYPDVEGETEIYCQLVVVE